MSERIDVTVMEDLLTNEGEEALQAALAGDAELAHAFEQWRALRGAVRAGLDRDLPDRALLVLYALEARTPEAGVLTPAEAHALAAARPQLERALEAHPALQDVVRDIRGAAAAFDTAWKAHFGGAAVREERPARPPARRQAYRWVARTAVGLALVVFAAVALLLLQRDRSTVTVAAAAGEVRLVELVDGTRIRLLGGSTLTYVDPARGAAFDRRVRLEGRAYFQVAADREGFLVETPTARMTVLGTSFGVRAEPAVTEVVLATGRLSLAPEGAPARFVILEPGQRSRVAAHALPTTPEPVDLVEALAWTDLFVFEATALEEIAERLEQHYEVDISVAEALRSEPVTGTFSRAQPVEEVLRTIAYALDAVLRVDADGRLRVEPR